ncbi:hypothetical protein VKT23_008081 [Stygiomarasmius scandens]|uniref:F-box domain-containing protein n=1 Tax=Marasmiellus scandens TaxID=2682957 RepID=A0ABR1JJ96_9AGAR
MIDKLPVELALSIVAYLPVCSICSLQLTCTIFNHTAIRANESQIYHAAAVNMGWIPSTNFTLDDVSSIYALSGIQDWKSLCQRRLQIERSWSGKGYSSLVAYTATGTSVHRFKVDEKVGIIVLTTADSGIKVAFRQAIWW